MTPIAVEIISQNFQELLNFAGNIYTSVDGEI